MATVTRRAPTGLLGKRSSASGEGDDNGGKKPDRRQAPGKDHYKPKSTPAVSKNKERCDRCKIDSKTCDHHKGNDPCSVCRGAGATACTFNKGVSKYVGLKKPALQSRLQQAFNTLDRIHRLRTVASRYERAQRLRLVEALIEELGGPIDDEENEENEEDEDEDEDDEGEGEEDGEGENMEGRDNERRGANEEGPEKMVVETP